MQEFKTGQVKTSPQSVCLPSKYNSLSIYRQNTIVSKNGIVIDLFRHKYSIMSAAASNKKGDDADAGPDDKDDAVDYIQKMEVMLEGEQLVLAAARHVQMAQQQRLLY